MANSTTNLDLVLQSQASKEVTVNAALDSMSPASVYGRRSSTCSGLTWGFFGGNVTLSGGTMSQIANGTLTLTASATNYIVANKATGAVSFSTATTNWNDSANYWRLYSAVVGAATVTSYTDSRELAKYTGGGSTGAGSGTVTTVSVVSSNGFSGSVANPTTTPAITLSTGVTGLLKGAAGALVAATNADLPAMSATVGGAVPTPPNDPAKFLNGQGAFVVPSGSGDMVLASAQTITGAKTFKAATLLLRNIADTFSSVFATACTAARTWTFPDKDGTVAMLSDITGTNWGSIGGTLSSQTDLQAALSAKANSSAVPAKVNLTQGTNVTITGTYPNLTISSAAIPAQFNPIAGTNVTLTGTYPNITFNASTSGGSMTYPSGSGIPVVAAGSSWGTTVAAPSGGIVGTTDAQTLTNKRVTARVGSTTSSATPTINTDLYDVYKLTAQAVDITSFTTNLTGTPADGDILIIEITGTAARAITWGASFEASTVALPTTTVTTSMLAVALMWNAATSKWRCMGAV